MTRVFADAVYWVALASPHDQWHRRAVLATRALGTAQIITTEEVFVEFLAHFSGYGRQAREGAILYFDTVEPVGQHRGLLQRSSRPASGRGWRAGVTVAPAPT